MPSGHRIRVVEYGIENAYGVRDVVKETRVTRLLWRVPTTATRYQIEMVFPRGFETSRKAYLVYFVAEADSDEEV